MWPDLIAKSKEGGVDVIQTYVFWNGHEAVRGQVVGQIPEHFFFSFSFSYSTFASSSIFSITLRGDMILSSL